MHDGKPQTCPLANRFGGEKRFKDPVAGLAGHAATRIGATEENIGSWLGDAVVGDRAGIDLDIASLDGQLPASWHGITGIDREIESHLFELSRISTNGTKHRIEFCDQGQILADEPMEHLFGIRDDGVQVDDLGRKNLLPTERE